MPSDNLTPVFTEAATPVNMTPKESGKKWRNANFAAYTKYQHEYRHDNSKWQTDAKYLGREVVAWDGEGITDEDGSHRYVMLAVKSADDQDYLENVHGLGSAACFDFILAASERNPGGLHVIYGGSYDFNMMMRDLPRDDVWKVMNRKYHTWRGYRIGYRQGKSFYVCKVVEGKKVGAGVTIYDVVSFFQTSFVRACDSYLGDAFTNRDVIVSNKALRSSFSEADIPEVRRYNDYELDNLLALVRELRFRLNRVGLRPRRWDGPGAVAAALLMRERVKGSMGEVPVEVAKTVRHSYAGGRFEVIRFGHVEGPAYEYDINSAYPAAMTQLPVLAGGTWEHMDGDPGDVPFAVYHVTWSVGNRYLPGPFFRRDSNGTICYPCVSTGWYWSPEVAVGRRYMETRTDRPEDVLTDRMEVLEAWVFHPATDDKPFEFVEKLFNKRRALKKAGDGANVAIKIGLSSLYGKTAQQVGWERTEKGLRTPPFHQLEWAGYTTSWCRARVLEACLSDLGSVIAFETDAVFTSRPLPVKVGTGLGEWEATEFSSLTYVTSGVYFGTTVEGEERVTKTRGVDLGQMTREIVLERMGRRLAEDRVVAVDVTRFIGAKVALAQDWSKWLRWVTMTKHVRLEPTGKRVHTQCAQDSPVTSRHEPSEVGTMIAYGAWHNTICPMQNDAESCEFPVEWINPDPLMTELAELRGEDKDYE